MHYRGLGILTLSVMIVASDSTSDADGVTEQLMRLTPVRNVEFTIDVPSDTVVRVAVTTRNYKFRFKYLGDRCQTADDYCNQAPWPTASDMAGQQADVSRSRRV